MQFLQLVISAIVAMAVFGVLLERIVIRPILGQPAFFIVMLTIGIGTETHTLPVPYKDQIWNVGGNENGQGALLLNVEQMVVIVATAVLCLLLFARINGYG